MTRRVTILGCGSSGGVPRLGENWGACDPSNPKNRRQRCSILVEQFGPEGTTRVLIDSSPDLRTQLLTAQVGRARCRGLYPCPCRSRARAGRSADDRHQHAPPPASLGG